MEKQTILHIIRIALLWVAAFVIAWCLESCKTQYIPVPEYHTIIQRDTVNTRDSIRIHTREYIKGDTVHKDSIVYRDRWRDRVVEIQTHDSILCPVEVIKEVPKRTGYDKFCSWAFWIIAVVTIVYWAAKILYKIYFRK